MNLLFRFLQYLKYQKKAKSKYYLHSPFVYQFYLQVLEGEAEESLKRIVTLREKLRSNNSFIKVEDFGTGKSSSRKICNLETNVAVKEKYGDLLYRLVKYFQPQSILEIGTSIGISSAYMAVANTKANIVSLEGSESLIEVAKQNHVELGTNNCRFVCGDFDRTLGVALKENSSVDLILFDGNHTKEATLRYFYQCLPFANEYSVFVFDDIYWSREMRQAWDEIKLYQQITLTLDVYQFGICFFRKEKLAKENFMLRY